MKKNYRYIGFMVVSFFIVLACKDDFLEKRPYGAIGEATLSTKAGVDGLLIGAYSLLDGGGAVGGGYNAGLEKFGSDDANLGTETGGSIINCFLFDPTTQEFSNRWKFWYAAVQRCNDVLKLLPNVTDATSDEKLQIEAEAKFLRGIYYLYLAMFWENVPWIDETISYSEGNYFVPNNTPIYPKIEGDFKFAADNLSETKSSVGRGNKWAAKSFLVKTLMFQKKYSEAIAHLDEIIANGQTSNGLKYELLSKYNDNFITETKHGSEAVFTVQMSVNDGANGANGNPMDFYNGPYGGPATCCYGWYQPTFDLVDAYQTNPETGLPLLDTYHETPIKNDQGLASSDPFSPHEGTLDSRLDWVVGRRGIPYRDWGVFPGKAWVRNQPIAGPYVAIKNIATQANVENERQGGGGGTSNPLNLIRFADVLLWAAECEIEVGSLAKAQEYVNMVRARAANPEGWVYQYADPDNPTGGFSNKPAANYKVGLYPDGQFSVNGKSYARKAVRFERRLELAMEHHRFFDLRRYDGNDFDQAEHFNRFMKREGNVPDLYAPNYLSGNFEKGKHELYPIPQDQIDLSEVDGASILTQNPGYN